MDPELLERARKRVGTTLRDKYHLDDVLGAGGMAVVYRATHRNQRHFAIKMLHPELSIRESLRQRFLQEGYAANKVQHPGVVAVVDDDVTEDGAAFLVMELLDGTSVHALAKSHGKRVPIPIACGILDQLLDVLAAAHAAGIVHRDIKPANLHVTSDGTLKVLDFGIARVRDAMATGQGMTATGELLGTPGFMAPEQARGQAVDARADLWAAGATFFTLVSGKFVHAGDNGPQLMVAAATTMPRAVTTFADVPPDLARVIDKVLDFEPSMRWSSASEMQRALRTVVTEAFGATLGREGLAAFLRADASTPPSAPLLPTPISSLPFVPIAQTVATTTSSTYEPNGGARKSNLITYVAVGLVVLAMLGLGVQRLAAMVGARHPVPAATAEETTQTIDTAAAPPTVTTSEPAGASAERAMPSVAPTHRANVVAPQAHPKPATPGNCNPPYYFDDDGNKIFKKECL